jgi:hypothetical protein
VEEEAPVLLARERVERVREERKRLQKIQEVRQLEAQAKGEPLEAQRSSAGSPSRSPGSRR